MNKTLARKQLRQLQPNLGLLAIAPVEGRLAEHSMAFYTASSRNVHRWLLAIGFVFAGAPPAMAQDPDPITPVPTLKLTPQAVPAVDQAAGVTPVPQVNVNSPARFDNLGIRGWNIAFPSYGDTLTQDLGGYRTKLAEYGVGFEMINVNRGFYNLLGSPRTTNGQQAYIGQQLTGYAQFIPVVTADLGRYGIPDGQITVAGLLQASSVPNFVPHNQQIYELTYYQTLFNKRIELKAGYISNGQEFVGNYTGGQIAGSIFGPSAAIPFELGLGSGATPGVNVTLNITDHIYDKFGIQRSTSPTPNTVVDEARINPTGFHFTEPGHGVVYINEVGYKETVSGLYHTWVRAGGIYNTSEYANYRTGGKNTEYGFYLLGDQQIWQPIKSGPARALGVYAGFSVLYGKPDETVFSQYYEGRLYAVGIVPGRPRDLSGVTLNYNRFSPPLRDRLNAVSGRTGNFAHADTTSVTVSYAARVITGLYLTTGLSYVNNPSFSYVRGEGHSLNAQFALTSVF